MDNGKIYRKKLTEAGVGVCFLAFSAVIVSAMGLAMEFLGTLGYNQYNDVQQSYVYASNVYDYIFTYDKSIITFIISLAAFFIFIAYKKKKKIGAEMPFLLTVSSMICAVKPIAFLVYALNDREFLELFKDSGDSRSFLAIMTLLIYILPLVSCLFLLMCGLVLSIKLIKEDFKVEVPVLKFEKVKKQDDKDDLMSDKETIYDKPAEDKIKPEREHKNESSIPLSGPKAIPASAEMIDDPKISVCTKCGNPVKSGSKFCQYCGEKI